MAKSDVYEMNVEIIGDKKNPLYNGIASLDAIEKALPEKGSFTMIYSFGNRRGSAKMVHLIHECRNILGVEVKNGDKYLEFANTGKDLPEKTEIKFSGDKSAVVAFFVNYVLSIPRMVNGSWSTQLKRFDEQKAAFGLFLNHITPSGVEMFLTTGKFCGGRLLPLSDKKNISNMISYVRTEKRQLFSLK
jgi:hypothetical protein